MTSSKSGLLTSLTLSLSQRAQLFYPIFDFAQQDTNRNREKAVNWQTDLDTCISGTDHAPKKSGRLRMSGFCYSSTSQANLSELTGAEFAVLYHFLAGMNRQKLPYKKMKKFLNVKRQEVTE